jgi:serine/threonine protein phosphatase PrpC
MITVEVAAVTSRGSVRETNQDRIGVFGWCAPTELTTPTLLRTSVDQPLAVVVADGLGGHLAGEIASEFAVRAVLQGAPGFGTPEGLRKLCGEIHFDLLAESHDRPEWQAMGTTLLVAVVTPESLFVCWIGDSRAYYIEPGFCDQLTEDDADAAGALTQVVGGLSEDPIDPHLTAVEAQPRTRLLLCSDGLYGPVAPDVLRDLAARPDLLTAAAELSAAAYSAGAPDNVSLCLMEIHGTDRQPEVLE